MIRLTVGWVLSSIATCTSATPSSHATARSSWDGSATTFAAVAESSSPSNESNAGCDPERVCFPLGLAQLGRAAPETRFEERPPRAARLRAFAIDAREVAHRGYQRCVDAGSCTPLHCDDGSNPSDAGPARCVSWEQARTYCAFAHGRLPSEAEWERTAAGSLPGHRVYPWGDRLETGASPPDRTADGVQDLGGSVAEWVEDVGAFYLLPRIASTDGGHIDGAVDVPALPIDTTERELATSAAEAMALDAGLPIVDDPHGPSAGPWRVLRGGDDHVPRSEWTTTRRRFRLPTDRRSWIGFRCAYAQAIEDASAGD